MTKILHLLRALPVALMLAAPAMALDIEAMTDAERELFRSEVRAYLLENPEVLMEAIGILQEREEQALQEADRQLAAANADALFNDGYSWVGGNPDGDITLVEFMDYRCGYCKQAFAEVNALIKDDGNIRFVVKELPILGEQSVLASQFAIAVQQLHGDDMYENIHDALMTQRTDISFDSLTELALAYGLDDIALFSHMNGPEVAEVIGKNAALANALQISGTPTFVVADQMLRGYVPLPQMEQIVAMVRAQ